VKKRIIQHILFWIAYLSYKTYLNIAAFPEDDHTIKFVEMFSTSIKAQLTFLIIKIPLVYTLFAIVKRFNLKNWGAVKTFFLSLLLLLIGTFLFTLINNLFVLPYIYKFPGISIAKIGISSMLYNAFVLVFVCGTALAIKLVRINLEISKREEETARKKLITELQFLKSQINPHFLFNTLNNIYGLARKKSDDTAEVVMKLSKLLRFMLYETSHPSIKIEDELKVVKDYIELEQLRYGARLDIRYHEEIDQLDQQITPLILIPFVENAFKHGLSETRFNSYIYISTKLKDQILEFSIENSKPETEGRSRERIGLKNVKRQLELLYPEHDLQIQVTPDVFKVHLTINLANNAAL
jgi:two-component system LytT family sensor kinase